MIDRTARRHQLLVHLAALTPLAWLIFDAARGNLGANPIQAVEQRTGKYALILLAASLACTPLNTVTGWRPVLRWRAAVGALRFCVRRAAFPNVPRARLRL